MSRSPIGEVSENIGFTLVALALIGLIGFSVAQCAGNEDASVACVKVGGFWIDGACRKDEP